MSNEQACKKAMNDLDYDTAVTIGSYLGELKSELRRLRGDCVDVFGGNTSPGSTYTAEIKVVKVKKGAASVIIVDNKRYVLDMANK